MKKMVLLAAIMLMGVIQNVNAQNEYSLEGIGKALSKLNFTSSALCLGDFHEGLAWVLVGSGENERYGFIDNQGNIVVSCIYKSANDFSDGLARIKDSEGRYGFIDRSGEVAIPCTLEERPGDFSEGLALVKSYENHKDRVGFINKQGELVIPYIGEESYGGAFGGGLAPIQVKKDEIYFIDKNGNTAIPSKPYRCLGYKDGYFYVRDEQSRAYGVIDTKGNIVIPTKYGTVKELSEGLFAVEKEGYKWGYVNLQGQAPFSNLFDEAQPFSEDFAAVQIEKKWGYINKQGVLVIPNKFKEAYDFHKGLAFVKSDEGYSVIDKQGNVVSKLPNYEYFRGNFSEGLAVIKQNGKWGYVDVYGNSTLNPNVMGNTKP